MIKGTRCTSVSVARIERLDGSPADRLDALVAESEASGLRFVRRLVEEWVSGAENPAAARLYERLGFRRVGAGDDTHVMELSRTARR